jgi:hypothetical protein
MELRLGPLPVLQTLWDKEPFYRRRGIQKGTGDCPLGRASALGDGGFRFRRSGFPEAAVSCIGKWPKIFPVFPVYGNDREPMEKAPSPHRKINRKMVCLYKTPFFDFSMASPWVFRCIPQLKIET